ncbi:MAG: hypothetical protein WC371_03065 [Parachlamydiales bacterium]|jgi:large subunit ribosomal protein L25
MELTLHKREAKTKGALSKIRLEGNIPAVIYTPGGPTETVFIPKAEFETLLRTVKKGRLSTTLLTLKAGQEKFKALVKDIQYHFATTKFCMLIF